MFVSANTIHDAVECQIKVCYLTKSSWSADTFGKNLKYTINGKMRNKDYNINSFRCVNIN